MRSRHAVRAMRRQLTCNCANAPLAMAVASNLITALPIPLSSVNRYHNAREMLLMWVCTN